MSVYWWNGKLLFRNGKLAKGPACCCDTCDPLDYGLYPTGHGLQNYGDKDLYWTGTCDTWCLCPAGSWEPCYVWFDCGLCKWMAPGSNCDTDWPAQDWTQSLTFNVPADKPLIDFTVRVMADNCIVSAVLNGTDLGVECLPPNTLTETVKCFQCWTAFLIGPSNGLKYGSNTLTLTLRNYPQPGTSNPSPMGYCVFFECYDTRSEARCGLPSSSTCGS